MGRNRQYENAAQRVRAFRARKALQHKRNETAITKGEREELRRVVRQNFKVARNGIETVRAERLADFEQQLATIYKPEDDPIWKQQENLAREVVAHAQAEIAKRNRELGIPEESCPGLQLSWYGRGSTWSATRRAELRRVAITRLDAQAKRAKMLLDEREAAMTTELALTALSSDAAVTFLGQIPEPTELLPKLDILDAGFQRLINAAKESD